MISIRYGHPDHPDLIARKCIWHLFHWNVLTPAGTTFDQIAIDASYVTKLPTSRLLPLSGTPIRHFLDYFICQRYYNQKYCPHFSFLCVTYLVNIEPPRQECQIGDSRFPAARLYLPNQSTGYHRRRRKELGSALTKVCPKKWFHFSNMTRSHI